MNVSLTPQLERMINQKVKTGMYQTASEVVREGLRLMQERDKAKARLRADVLAGFEEVERGEYTEYDGKTVRELAEQVIARGKKRLLRESATREK